MMSHAVFDRLTAFRRSTGKTWAQVASELDLSVAMLMMVKGGKRNLSDKALYRLRQAERNAGITPPAIGEAKPAPAKAPPDEKTALKIEQNLTGNYPTFPARLHWLREQCLRMPLREFATSVNASKTYIYNLEKGKRDNPSANLLEAICAKHHVRLEWLRDGQGFPRISEAQLIHQMRGTSSNPGLGALSHSFPINHDPNGMLRVVINQMDNAELIEKVIAVLAVSHISSDDKLHVVKLYASALRERLQPDAIKAAQEEAAAAKAEAAAAKAEVEELRTELADLEEEMKLREDEEAAFHAATDALIAELKKMPKITIKGQHDRSAGDGSSSPHADAA